MRPMFWLMDHIPDSSPRVKNKQCLEAHDTFQYAMVEQKCICCCNVEESVGSAPHYLKRHVER